MPSFDQCLERAKVLIAEDIEVELQRAAVQAVRNHKLLWPVGKRTGHLAGDIRAKATPDGIMISMPGYAAFLEYGTGLYGPLKRRIYPKTKQALAWGKSTPKGKEFVVRSIRGMHKSPFIRPFFHAKLLDIIIRDLNIAFEEVDL